MLKKVAVTGGLSSGKSTVCLFFKEFGAYVVSADEIVHQLLSPNRPAGQEVIKLLGPDIVFHDQIDRSRVARHVFNNPQLLHSLEQVLHPAVRHEIDRQYQNVKEIGDLSLFVAEIPLLFEGMTISSSNGSCKEACGGQYDYTIAVIADKETSRNRYKQVSGHSEEEFDKRMARQLSPEEKARLATFVIRNDGSLEELRRAVKKIYMTMINHDKKTIK